MIDDERALYELLLNNFPLAPPSDILTIARVILASDWSRQSAAQCSFCKGIGEIGGTGGADACPACGGKGTREAEIECARLRSAAQARNAALEEAAKVVCPGNYKKPCDCITQSGEGVWLHDCHCQNSGDLSDAVSWCGATNDAVRIRALKSHDGGSPPDPEYLKEWDNLMTSNPKGASPSLRSGPSPEPPPGSTAGYEKAQSIVEAWLGHAGDAYIDHIGSSKARDLISAIAAVLQSPATEAPAQRCCVTCNAVLADGPQPAATYEKLPDLTVIAAQMADALDKIASYQAPLGGDYPLGDQSIYQHIAAERGRTARETLAAYEAQIAAARPAGG